MRGQISRKQIKIFINLFRLSGRDFFLDITLMKMKEVLEIVTTKEGVHTLVNNRLQEHYHSMYGSLEESMLVFIKNGLCTVNKNLPEISILEMGFGTGLNAILTYRENQVMRKPIHYTTVEAFPLPSTVTDRLNYFEYFGKPLQPVFSGMHSCKWFENV